MLEWAQSAGIPADVVYGQQNAFRGTCERLGYSYVLAIPSNQHVITARTGREHRADELAAALPAQSAGLSAQQHWRPQLFRMTRSAGPGRTRLRPPPASS